MRKTLIVIPAALAVAVGALAPTGVADNGQPRNIKRPAYGLTGDGSLVRFDAANPSRAERVARITGLASGERLVGIDFRPVTGELYGLGDKSNLYEIATQSARGTMRSSLKTGSGAGLALQGTRFGIDFNPTVDRLRVTSDARQNLRVNVDTGAATVDRAIAYAPRDRNAGKQPQPVGVAYTNNDNDQTTGGPLISFGRSPATGTKLFSIDAARGSLALHDPPNDGTLRTVGRLRQRTTSAVGFDVYSYPNSEGNTASNTAYASLRRGGRARLYKVSLATGRAKPVRGGGGSFRAVEDIAIRP